MTIKQLKEIIADKPEHMELCVDISEIDPGAEFKIVGVENAEIRNIRFHEGNEPGTEPEAFIDCLILTIEE